MGNSYGLLTSSNDATHLQNLLSLKTKQHGDVFKTFIDKMGISMSIVHKIHKVTVLIEDAVDGKIDKKEFLDMIEVIPSPIAMSALSAINSSPKINFMELFVSFYHFCCADQTQIIQHTFKRVDKDGDGKLTIKEMKLLVHDVHWESHYIMKSIGDNQSNVNIDQEADKVMSDMDTYKQGFISFEMFVQGLKFHPKILQPGYQVQQAFRKAIGGQQFWTHEAVRQSANTLEVYHNAIHTVRDQTRNSLARSSVHKHDHENADQHNHSNSPPIDGIDEEVTVKTKRNHHPTQSSQKNQVAYSDIDRKEVHSNETDPISIRDSGSLERRSMTDSNSVGRRSGERRRTTHDSTSPIDSSSVERRKTTPGATSAGRRSSRDSEHRKPVPARAAVRLSVDSELMSKAAQEHAAKPKRTSAQDILSSFHKDQGHNKGYNGIEEHGDSPKQAKPQRLSLPTFHEEKYQIKKK